MYLHHFSARSKRNINPLNVVNGMVLYALQLVTRIVLLNIQSAVTLNFSSKKFHNKERQK
jgi:hypothetical protein